MSLYFGISEAAVSNYIELLKPVLKKALLASGEKLVRSYQSAREFEELLGEVEDILVDVFEIPIQRPSDEEKQKDTYSGKKTSYPKMAYYGGQTQADTFVKSLL